MEDESNKVEDAHKLTLQSRTSATETQEENDDDHQEKEQEEATATATVAIRCHQQQHLQMNHQAQQTQYINHNFPFEPFMNGHPHYQGIHHPYPHPHAHPHHHHSHHQGFQNHPRAQVHNGQTPFLPSQTEPGPIPMPVQMPVAADCSSNVQIDPMLQVQYYESRMRDHAAAYAQYASAAAGAALAAAQVATVPGSFYASNLPSPIAFFPNNINNNNSNMNDNAIANGKGTINTNGKTNNSPGMMHANVNANGAFQHQQQMNNQYGMSDTKQAKKQKRSSHPGHGHSKTNRRPSRAPIAPDIDSANEETLRRRKHNSNLPAIRQYHDMGKPTKRGSIKSLDFMGKTGVSALYDLCNKRHWSQPKFITNEQPHNNDSSTCTSSAHMEFIISVELNGVILSRGRGGSKKSAQQDAARKALNVIYPGTVFDANGILLVLGKTDKCSIVLKGHDQQGACCPLKDLEANMASRLAIHGNQTKDRISPALSEDSSISTTLSMSKGKASAMVVTGGPFIQQKDRTRNRLVFPSASTTSGISSASEDVDDDEYLASRGASVCTSLLYAMVQIGRIKEQPTYAFDVCANPATIAQQQQQQQQQQQHIACEKGSTKRKGVGFSGVGGAIVSKRRSATNAVGHVVTIHRNSFACTATLILCKDKLKPKDEHDDPKKCDESLVRYTEIESLDGKNEFVKMKANDPPQGEDLVASTRPLVVDGIQDRRPNSDSVNDFSIDTLQAVGTGATKREARHIASAKLLAKLFPDCNGMVEVKTAAQAAQAQYAAKRAKLKRAAQSDGGKFAKRDRRRKIEDGSSEAQEKLSLVYSKPQDPTVPYWLSKYLMANTELETKTTKKIDSADDLAKLSLSEPSRNEQRVRPLEGNGKLQVSRQRQFEENVDAALQILNDAEDERKPSYFKDNDLGKTILRRATIEDVDSIEKLLAKEDTEKKPAARQNRPNALSSISPLALTGMTSRRIIENMTSGIDITSAASQLWGSQSIVLTLSRAIALPDEPPLGFAVLSMGFSMKKGRILQISEVANEVHFPRERLIECLDELGEKMHCQVEASCGNLGRSGILFTDYQLCDIIKSHTKGTKHAHVSETTTDVQHDPSQLHGKPLQSVKEEEHEDDDVKSDQNHKRIKYCTYRS